MIIHFIGQAGSGKSALAEAILLTRPDLRPRPEQDGFELYWYARIRLLLPHYIRIGREIAAYDSDGRKRTGPWRWAYAIAVEMVRPQFGGNWIIHHGFTNTMRKASKPIDPDLASRLPFPDVIVNVGTSTAIRSARLIKRNKTPSRAKPLSADVQMETARRHARRWLRIWPEEVVFDYLDAFNHRRCRPLFTDAELRALMASEKGAPLDEADQRALTYTPLPESYAWLKDVFVAQGGTWIDFENSGTSDLQEAAEDLLSRLPLP